jgi:transposase-like protein
MGGRAPVESDETYIGGKTANMHKSKRARYANPTGMAHMTPVMGLLERKAGAKHSTVRLDVLPGTKRRDLLQRIDGNVERGSALYTDAHPSYRTLYERYEHAAIDHAVKYVDGQVNANRLEDFWSLLKRSIRGAYVSVDPFHLFRYLDERAYRFNERTKTDLERFVGLLRDVIGKRLTYATLISADMLPAMT